MIIQESVRKPAQNAGFRFERGKSGYARDSVFFAHLLEHEKHLSFTMRKKLNPIPCFGYGAGDRIKLPKKNGRFGFDMEKGSWVPPHGKGEIADFWIRYDETSTNECAILEFDGMFNGAYKQTQRPSTSFKSTYRADTNHVYTQRMTIWTWRREGNESYQSQFVSNDEYLVDHVKRIEVSIVCKIEHDF